MTVEIVEGVEIEDAGTPVSYTVHPGHTVVVADIGRGSLDREVLAVAACVSVIQLLDDEARARVAAYLTVRFVPDADQGGDTP